MSPSPSIPWGRPNYWGREREYVADALESSWISAGPYLDRLEREVATYCQTPHALAVANGTVSNLATKLLSQDSVLWRPQM
jgi:perosamine synthetase